MVRISYSVPVDPYLALIDTVILSGEEIIELTGKRRVDAQARVLRALGIEFRPRPDGSLVVSRAHVEHLLGGGRGVKLKEVEPKWGHFAKAT